MLKLLKLAGLLEGLSSILLFLIALPMRYFLDNGSLIFYAGMTHGVCFTLFFVVLLVACHVKKWSVGMFVFGLLSAIIPLGTFIFDWKIRKLD